jgi:glyoxylase-like metal-dependent hydrolase (beta-lactamase superfamily II)
MPGKLTNGTDINSIPRPINTNIKSRKIIFEPEHPVRWSFLKVLREYSTLREFYPEINPYTECYKVRDNTWALYNDSFDGVGDVWMYLIDGPEKCMIVDTSFGVGDLKGLIKHLVGDNPIVVCNTHSHYDHCYGNAQFGECYCHENEVPDMESKNNAHIWDYLFNQTDKPIKVADEMVAPGMPLYTEFDPKDVIKYQPWKINGVKNNHLFDLGGGYIVEAILIPGHTAGQCGYYDHQTGCFFVGDLTGIGGKPKGAPYREFCCVEAMHDELEKIQPRLKDMSGIFPGHGMFDVHPIILRYLYETTNQILKDPENYDSIRTFSRNNQEMVSATKNIFQWTALRYNPKLVYRQQILDDEKN